MRFGIIGAGSIAANSFAPSLMRSKRAELAAVCRRDLGRAREFAGRFGGCAAFGSAEELVKSGEVDAVIVTTPTDTHCEYTVLAARQGLHVLCEKPMARNAGECRAMIKECQHSGVRLGVAYRRRVWPQVVEARRLIEAGRIGRVVCVRTHYSGLTELAEGAWQRRPEIGGALMEMAVHRIEVLLNFAGRPTSVSALVETVSHDWPVDDSVALLLQFADGKIGVHSTILTSPPRHDFAQVDGTEGRLILDPLEFHADRVLVESGSGSEAIPVTALESPYFDLPMIEDFVDAVQEGREPACDAVSGYWVQAVADAAVESYREGVRVPVRGPDWH
ncbi:MAG: Gfo/Idh/MocA family oxidoreductase [Gemmatimonadota bacterium]